MPASGLQGLKLPWGCGAGGSQRQLHTQLRLFLNKQNIYKTSADLTIGLSATGSMVDISSARLGSILLGWAHTFSGAAKLHRFDSFTRFHDDQVRVGQESVLEELGGSGGRVLVGGYEGNTKSLFRHVQHLAAIRLCACPPKHCSL